MRAPRLYPERTLNRGGLPDVTKLLARKLAPVLALLCLVPATASASMAEANPPDNQSSAPVWTGATPPEDEQWQHLMGWYLLWLYETMGGDPGLLDDENIAECSEGVVDYYTKDGLPTNMSEPLRLNFRSAIETTALLVQLAPAGELSPAQAIIIMTVLREMYSDVGGDPDTLL